MNQRPFDDYLSSCCDLCGVIGNFRSCLCGGCLDDLPYLLHACHRCGLPLPAGVFECGKCLNREFTANCTVTAFHYRYPVDELIKQLKYKEKIRLAEPLVDSLLNRIEGINGVLPEVLIPVPLHHYRMYRRGYNQAVIISRLLTRRLGIQTDAGLIRRQRNTSPMFNLNAAQRRQNIRGVFKLQRPCTYASVAIVDDVITSGSTVNELAGILRSAGVRQIQLWALARAE